MLYLTPTFFKRIPTGAAVAERTDETLARALAIATNEVNRYTASPKLPRPHDFRGDTISGEQHIWDLGNNFRKGSDRLYPLHTPMRSIDEFRLRVTSDQYVDFEPADIYINNSEGYIEVISLARRLSVFSAGFVPVIGLRQPVAELAYTYGYRFPVIDEPFYPSENVRTFRGENQWWSDDPVTVKLDGDIVTDVVINRNEGTVTFPSVVDEGQGVTVSYTHRLPWEIRDATALIAANVFEAERFISGGLTGLAGVRAEEAELRFNRNGTVLDGVVDGRAQGLLDRFRFRSWG